MDDYIIYKYADVFHVLIYQVGTTMIITKLYMRGLVKLSQWTRIPPIFFLYSVRMNFVIFLVLSLILRGWWQVFTIWMSVWFFLKIIILTIGFKRYGDQL